MVTLAQEQLSVCSCCDESKGQVIASGGCLRWLPLVLASDVQRQGRSSSPALLAGSCLRPGACGTQFALCPSVASNFSSYMLRLETKISTQQQLSFTLKGWLLKIFFFTVFLPLRSLWNILQQHSSQINSTSRPSSWQQCIRTT